MKRAGWDIPAPPASMFAWAPIPEQFKEAGSLLFSKLLIEEAGVAVAPGVGFGEYGEGYVRIGLVENEQRIRQAARNVKKFLGQRRTRSWTAPTTPWRRNGASMDGQDVWRIGVAGLGTVGAGLLKFLGERPDFAPGRRPGRWSPASRPARARGRGRSTSPASPGSTIRSRWPRSPDIDLFVELIGGSDGPAKAAVEAALKAGKPVVTANKALIAEHGAELARAGREPRACRCCSRRRSWAARRR